MQINKTLSLLLFLILTVLTIPLQWTEAKAINDDKNNQKYRSRDTTRVDQESEKLNLLQYVNTLQGSHNTSEFSHGRTSPVVGLPHGMNYWSPAGYPYNDGTIPGFEGGGFSLMPQTGSLQASEEDLSAGAAFSNSNVTGKPHYYRVTFDNGITTEITATQRSAIFQFDYPRPVEAYLLFNGSDRMNEVSIEPENRQITGYITNKVWHDERYYKTYFILQFDQPFTSYGTSSTETGSISENKQHAAGEGIGAYVAFEEGARVQAKAATSKIGLAQAETTLEREVGPHNFNEVKEAAGEAWNTLLNKIVVEGGTQEQKKTFYSTLYRANLRPGKAYEVDEEGDPYFYFDGKVHDGYYHSGPILWDAFRSLLPLHNIINTAGQQEYLKSLQLTKPLTGWWPNGHVMIGNHAISVFADAWAKGIRSFDPDSVLDYYYHEVTHSKLDTINNTAYNKEHQRGYGRMGHENYFAQGYIPYPQNTDRVMETTSKTLEYNYDDFAAYQLAKMTGNSFYQRAFRKHVYNYKNVFDPSDDFFKGRDIKGNWDHDFNPYEWGGPFVEGNGWQWKFSVPHDVGGLIKLMGGEKQFASELDELFDASSDSALHGGYGYRIHEISEAVAHGIGQYAPGNEPCFHVIYLYSYVGQPWKTQKFIRQSVTNHFNSTPKGFPGDEDGGAMSAWYVFSALGFYPVTPGTNQYALGSPLFDKATVTLEDGKTFIIRAENNSAENVYIQSAWLNGNEYAKNYITHSDITNGGTLTFDMSDKPNKKRGTKKGARPFSVSDAQSRMHGWND